MIRATQIQTAHFLLAKNQLTSAPGRHLIETVKALVAIPAETLLTPYLALRTRRVDMPPSDLISALIRSRRLLRRPAVRNELHLIAAADYPLFHGATQRQRRQHFNAEFINWEIEAGAVESLGQGIMALFEQTPLTMAAIMARLPPDSIKELTHTSRGGHVTTLSNAELALRWLESNGQLAAIPSAGSAAWETAELVYSPLSAWLPDLNLNDLPAEAEAQLDLTRRYLAAYGPATEADISFWTGFGKSETARATGALTRETTLVMVDGLPGAMLLLKTQAAALAEAQRTEGPLLNILAADDPFVKAHWASRARLISDPRLQRQVFNNAGQAKPTILVDGKIVGIWSWQNEAGPDKLTWQLLTEVEAALLPSIEAKLAEFAALPGPE